MTLNVWEAVYFDHDLDRLVDLAERAAALGVERYVLDDGWFGARRNDRAGLGDWTVSPDVWPDGLHPLVDTVTGLGMQFGLWFEPEMVNLDSDVARAHPEWIMATGDRLPVESRHQQVINLGIPECYAYIRDAIFAILAEYDIGYIKWDHNRDLIDAGTQPDRPPGRARADPRLLPAARRDQGRAPGPGDRVLLLRRRPGRPRRAGADRPGLGLGLHRPARAAADAPLDDPADPAGADGLAHRLRPLPHHRPGARPGLPRRRRRSSATSASSGTWPRQRRRSSNSCELDRAFKEHRDLLLGGDLVRMDVPDPSLDAARRGCAGPEPGASSGSPRSGVRRSSSPGRLRFPGLDPQRRYRVTPLMIDYPPIGLRPPLWWGVEREPVDQYSELAAASRIRYRVQDGAQLGIELPGAMLMEVGLAAAVVHPEHMVLYHLVGVD